MLIGINKFTLFIMKEYRNWTKMNLIIINFGIIFSD
jgi:hypothetical protein